MLTTASVVLPATRWEQQKMIKFPLKILTLIFPLLYIAGILKITAQDISGYQEGKVSYLTSQNIYVRFETTEGIASGDTLFVRDNNQLMPVLVVVQQSSVSCLCNALGDNKFKIDDTVFHRKKYGIKVRATETETEVETELQPEKDLHEEVLTTVPEIPGSTKKQTFTGRISASSYSNFSNSDVSDIHRFRYTFSSSAVHISGSRLSAESYIIFTHRQNQWHVVQENLNNALKIYNLAFRYDFNETVTLWAGRRINPRIANVGAIDGIQFEYGFKKMFVGIAAGSRPDYLDYGYNLNLFEYGAYFGQSQKVKNGFIQSSVAFFEQRNSGNVDRRFVYFQHTNSAVKNLNVFTSVELDLYRLLNNQSENTLILISLYLSANFRVSRKLSLSGSYDNRKNVIYYETFRNYADEILRQASRQGVRFRVNYRPVNYLMVGTSAGNRLRKGDPRPSNTFNGFVAWSRVPGINASLNVSANVMQTSYLDGQIYGVKVSKDIIPGKIYSTLQYRRVGFNYVNSATELKQNIGEVDFSFQINKKLFLTVNFEATIQENDWFNRLYLNLKRKF